MIIELSLYQSSCHPVTKAKPATTALYSKSVQRHTVVVVVVVVVLQTYLGRSRWTQLPWGQPTVRRSASVSVVQHGPPVWYTSVSTPVLQPDVLFRGCDCDVCA